MIPTIATLLNPRKGKFNVTEKGGLLENGYFDYDIVKPHLFTLVLLICGVLSGIVQLIWNEYYNIEPKVLALNLFWAGFSCIMLFASVAVAREMKQVRRTVRLDISLPVVLHLDSGHTRKTKSMNLSMGGAQVENVTEQEENERIVDIEISLNNTAMVFPVETIYRDEECIRFRFSELPIAQRRELVKVVMGRADAWLPSYTEHKDNNILLSCFRVMRSIAGLFQESIVKKKERDYEAEGAARPLSGWKARLALLVVIAVSAVILSNQALSAPAPTVAPDNSVKPANFRDGRTEMYSFEDLGAFEDIYFFGNNTASGMNFTLRNDEFVRSARLKLKLNYSEALLEDESFLDVVLNGQLLQTVELSPFNAKSLEVDIAIEPALILSSNNLGFRLTGRTVQECQNELSKDIWVKVQRDSLLTMSVQRLPVSADLSKFPEPFFNPGAMNRVTVPVVLPANASAATLTSGAIVASYIGRVAEYRHLNFPVMRNLIPMENAIVFVTPDQSIQGLTIPRINGPELRLIDNPLSPVYKLLLVMGRTPEELKTAATYLVTRSNAMQGTVVKAEKTAREPMQPYEVPRWTSTQRVVQFSEFLQEPQLASQGLFHPPVELNFRASPDLFFWDGEYIPMTINYNFPEGDWLDERESSLDVSLNGRFLTSLPVNQTGVWAMLNRWLGRDTRQETAQLRIPPYMLYGENKLRLYHHFAVNSPGCNLNVPKEITGRIHGESSIDLTAAKNFTQLPNLSYFVGVGFPFTRRADLSETVALLPKQPGNEEIETLFELAARMGRDTGYPALGLSVKMGLGYSQDLQGHDLLVISNFRELQSSRVLNQSAFAVERDRMQVKSYSTFDHMLWFLQGDWSRETKAAARVLDSAQNVQGLFSFVSPVDKERVVVVVAAETSAQLPSLIESLNKPLVSSEVLWDMSLVDAGGKVRSARVGEQIAVGRMPWHMELRWFFGQHIIFMVIGLALAAFAGAAILYPLLKHRAENRINKGLSRNE